MYVEKKDAIEAWHFCDGWKLRDGQKLIVGQEYIVDPPICICEKGLHASIRAIDALKYAPGSVCCRVAMWGEVLTQDDKICATNRLVIAAADVSSELHEFACGVAEAALMISDVKDKRSWAAIEAKRLWLRGKISDRDLAAAQDAARAAAQDAAWAGMNIVLTEYLVEKIG